MSAAWDGGTCCVPMFSTGSPDGLCGRAAFGPQLPLAFLTETRGPRTAPYCFGPCCPDHGGPRDGEVIIFQDGMTDRGRPMWCAVYPGFVNLQESPAGYDGNPVIAVALLRAASAIEGAP